MTGVDKKQSLAGQCSQRVPDFGEYHAGTLEFVSVGVLRQVVIHAIAVIHTVPRHEHNAHVARSHLPPNPLQPIQDVVALGVGIGQQFDFYLSVEKLFL